VNSSWHGTRVSSLIAALTNNAEGIAGTGWNTLILPVRVLGKCGGTDSDIIMGMRWAAGISVPNVPLNPTPAQIINLSLGGSGACSAAYQQAVNEITARVLIVARSATTARLSRRRRTAPACSAGRHPPRGTKVGFSNLGPGTGIAAPGGIVSTPTSHQLALPVPDHGGDEHPARRRRPHPVTRTTSRTSTSASASRRRWLRAPRR
jgi:serine protease